MKVKTSKNLMLAAAVVILLNCNSCKYDDGPMLSIRTKKARLTGEWEVVKINGEKLNDFTLIFEFEKDGDFSVTYSYFDYGQLYSYSYSGDWTWEDGKETVEIELDGDLEEFAIKRLTNKELWFEDEDNEEYECEKE